MDVQLEPQSQLLSRIQYVFNTESKFSFLTGESGVGKSFLTSMLVDNLTGTLVIELKGLKKFDLESFTQDIICQLATDDLSDINQTMAQAIQGAINYYGQSLLIIIDNAQHIPQTFINSLWHCYNEVMAEPQRAGYKLNMLLVGDKKWAQPIIGSLKEIDARLVIDFELNYLSTEQGIDFLTSIHPDWSDQKIENNVAILNSQPLTPQRLIFSEQPIATPSNLKWLVPGVVLLSLLIVIGVGWFFVSEASTAKTEKVIQLPPKLIVLSDKQQPRLLATTEAEREDNVGPKVVQQLSLPAQEQQIVTRVAVSIENDEPDSVLPVDSITNTGTVQQSGLTKDDGIVYFFDEKSLLAVSESHVSLMLGGYSHQSVLQRAIAKIDEKSELYTYKTIRHGKDWFVLLYGDFSSRTSAQQMLASSPSQLVFFSPWIKSFRVIHAEITAVAATMDNHN